MNLGLENKVCLVAGASRGLGRAVAQCLHDEGARVVIFSRDENKIQQAAREIGERALGLAADIADEAQSTRVVEETLRRYGTIHVLVNNSGGPPAGDFGSLSEEQWRAAFEMLVMGPLRLTRGALPAMREQKWGRVLNIVSSSVEQPIPGLMLSNSLRAAVAGWSKTLANEVASDGVLVNCLAPGSIETDRAKELIAAKVKKTGKSEEEVRAESRATIPVGRYGQPEEFGRAAAFLCSEAASYMTGSIVRADGGAIRSL